MSSPTIVMHGYMMKQKGGGSSAGSPARRLLRALLSSRWVTRYFVLLDDGRLVYYRERPAYLEKDGGTLLCGNAGGCKVERVKPDDLRDDHNPGRAADSFFMTLPDDDDWSLFVANGPEDYACWIKGFRNVKKSDLGAQIRPLSLAIECFYC